MDEFPKLALGTWLMGGMKDPDPDNDDQRDIDAIKLAIAEGVTLIDTAQNYANGRSEELVGQAIKGLDRDSFQILTKQRKERLSFDNVLEDCESSMARLGVEYIDYFVCHAPNEEFDMKDFFRASNQLHEEGKIRNVGVSNFGSNMLKLAVDESATPIVLNQVHFSLDDDDVLSTGTYDFCRENNIHIQAYRTLVNMDKNEKAYKVVSEIGAVVGLTPQQVAISYINSFDLMAFTIKASSKKHWDEIKAAVNTRLGDDYIKRIRDSHKDIKGNFRRYLEV